MRTRSLCRLSAPKLANCSRLAFHRVPGPVQTDFSRPSPATDVSFPRPLYLQVIEQVQRRVAVGDLSPGTELPSIRELAASLNVSVITIKRAYLELERDGVIATQQGKGSVIADRPGLQASVHERELRDHLKQVANLGLLLGLSKTELQRRLAEIYEQSNKAGK